MLTTIYKMSLGMSFDKDIIKQHMKAEMNIKYSKSCLVVKS